MGVQMGTVLFVADNSGPRFVRCIDILGKSNRCSNGRVGDILIVSVLSKRTNVSSDIRRGDKKRALLVSTRENLLRSDGSIFRIVDGDGKKKGRRFNNFVIGSNHCNRVVLIGDNNKPIGSRIFGPIPREIRYISMEIVNIASDVF